MKRQLPVELKSEGTFMQAVMDPHQEHPESAAPRRRRHVIRVVALAGWGLVLALEIGLAFANPTTANLIVAVAFVCLFALVNVKLVLIGWLEKRNWRRMTSKLHGSAYLSELHNLPNRNYVLAELRREMPRARATNSPCVLIQVSLDSLEGVRQRRGDEFAERALNSLVDVLKRLTRSSDFLAHLGGPKFCVLLVECTLEQSYIYLKRVPGMISVSDGHTMLDVPVTARVHQYDLESLYATDVLRDMEETQPLRRREAARANALAA
jgi:diguanylate cyclase (GGDEF)-like protein